MIAFASLFLGLIFGIQPVELVADPRVRAVELRLDDELVARLDAPPWKAVVDLGAELQPHELVAVALDEEGAELGRAHQWLNMPRPPAEADLVFEPGVDGRGATARLVWESTVAERPYASRVVFDGRELDVADPRAFELPPHDPERLHYLRVELEFSENVRSVVEATFGGTFTDRVSTRQTAVPVLLERGAELEVPVGDPSWITGKGEPLRVLAVEEGPAEVIVVRDKGAQGQIDALARQTRRGAGSLRFLARLKKRQSVRFLSPFPRITPRQGFNLELFPPTEEISPRDGGLFWMLLAIRPTAADSSQQRLADAVAVAGMMAASRGHRRAVVLILGDRPSDRSRHSAPVVRRYLESLRVPLFVWSVEPLSAETRAAWGEPDEISSLTKLETAGRALSRHLERQRVLWLEGFHLPRHLALTADAPQVAFVR